MSVGKPLSSRMLTLRNLYRKDTYKYEYVRGEFDARTEWSLLISIRRPYKTQDMVKIEQKCALLTINNFIKTLEILSVSMTRKKKQLFKNVIIATVFEIFLHYL